MLRRPLLVAVALSLLLLGVQQSSGAPGKRNGRIAFEHIGERSSGGQIYSTTAQGTNRHSLTPKQSSRTPAYSPRGSRIVFVGGYKQDDLWTMHADGSHQRGLTHTRRIDETDPDWSPDGTKIVFAVTRPASQQGIWVIGADGRHRRQLTSGLDDDPAWSPGGAEIAFDRHDDLGQFFNVLVVPADGGAPTNISSGGQGISDAQPAWSPAGNRILFTTDRPDTFRLDLWAMNPDGSDVRQVTNTPGSDEANPVWAPDGRWIAYSASGHSHGSASYQIFVSRPNGSSRRVITHACGLCTIINDYPTWQPLPG